MRTCAVILAVALACGPQPAGSQTPAEAPVDTLRLSLREAILMALAHNPTVSIQRLEPAIADTRVREESGAFEPRIRASASRSETESQRFLGSNPDPFELTSERLEYNLGISGRLPTGTSIELNAAITGNLSSIYADQYTGDLGLTVNQSLLQGLLPGYHLAGLRQARADADISRQELKAVGEQVTAQVERAYWKLYLASREHTIQRQSLDLAQVQLRESSERVAVGRLPKLELAAVNAEVAMRREAMIDAESLYEQARLNLLHWLNFPAEAAWRLVPLPQDEPFLPATELDPVALHVELAIKYRSDLKQARLQLQKGELELARTRSGLLPRLDLFVSLGRTTYARSLNESMPDPGSPFHSLAAGAVFDLPLTQRQARSRHARARYERDQLELELDNIRRSVQHDVRSAYIEVRRARQQIETTRVTRDLQEQKVAAEQEKFRVGKSTNLLVLQAQRDLIASKLSEARATVALLEALVGLHLAEGTMLERRGIESLAQRAGE